MSNTILVAGDFVLDHHVYQGSRHQLSDIANPGVQVHRQMGGANLVFELLRGLSIDTVESSDDEGRTKKEDTSVYTPQLSRILPEGAALKDVDQSRSAFAFWRPFSDSSGRRSWWRVSEAMGFGADASPPVEHVAYPESDSLSEPADVVVISEGGMGFRQSDEWEHLPLKAASSIILKSSGPLMQGKLWEEISSDEDGYRDKLTIVVSVNDLRRTSARISRGLSWDTTLRHVINELQAGNALERLTHCRHLIVSFGSEAALWIHFGDPSGAAHASFLFDPGVIEGDHALSVQGTAFGLQSCLTAAVANAVCRDKTPNLETGCEGGLSAMYNLLQQGHGPATEATSGFPAERLAKDIRHPSHRYSRARFTFPDSELPPSWSVLSESAKTSHTSGATDIPFETARLVALRGPIALENLPSVRVGHLLSVDRYETEALRALMNQMRNYRDHDSGSKPLSIGVFGPPGSGKSFGVKQMATEICGKNGWLEFNLSQFASTDDLIGAFHQIRDCVLRQIIPVAFFDEFDSQKLKWLQYLLAPMQDGKFQEGKLTHPIGKCIFVFAGGTSWTFDSFGPHEKASTSAHEEFRHAKGPDFKSRLDGYLNVIGPNQKKTLIPDGDGYEPGPPDLTDVCFPIRRALMLRSELRCDENAKLDMDEGILEAILHAKEFTHGSRSLSKILQPFKNGTTGPFYKSALPPLSQIGMHTDVDEFLKNCNSSTTPTSQLMAISGSQPLPDDGVFGEAQVQVLGRAIHDAYNALTGNNYEYSADTNEAAARRMIRNLALINLAITEGTNTDEERVWISRRIEYNLELLAEAEHDGWMQWHLEKNWRYAPGEKDSDEKTHPCLLPYIELSMQEQEKDRDGIRNYLHHVSIAQRKIVLVP